MSFEAVADASYVVVDGADHRVVVHLAFAVADVSLGEVVSNRLIERFAGKGFERRITVEVKIFLGRS